MICPPCCDDHCENCEDVQRFRGYVAWLRSKPFGPDAVIGPEENQVIRANRPYPSCPCQHSFIGENKVHAIERLAELAEQMEQTDEAV